MRRHYVVELTTGATFRTRDTFGSAHSVLDTLRATCGTIAVGEGYVWIALDHIIAIRPAIS